MLFRFYIILILLSSHALIIVESAQPRNENSTFLFSLQFLVQFLAFHPSEKKTLLFTTELKRRHIRSGELRTQLYMASIQGKRSSVKEKKIIYICSIRRETKQKSPTRVSSSTKSSRTCRGEGKQVIFLH